MCAHSGHSKPVSAHATEGATAGGRSKKRVPTSCAGHQDVGCCFGQESRKLIMDGFPEANVVVSDITPDYWCAPQMGLSFVM